MTPTLLYTGIAAGVAVIGGVGYAIYRHYLSPCPTAAEFASTLAEIDSGKIGRAEADGVIKRYDAQGCSNEAAAVRKLLAAKDSARRSLGGLTIASTDWPDSDPACKAAIDALPRDKRPNPTGGSPLPSYYEIVHTAVSDAHKGGDTRPLYNVADLLESAAAAAGAVDMSGKAATTFKNAATCLRSHADDLFAAAPKVMVAGRKPAGRPGVWVKLRPGQQIPPHLRRKLFAT